MNLLRAYYAIRNILNAVVEGEGGAAAKVARSAGAAGNAPLWDVTQGYVQAMSKTEAQIITLEKIFCLVFITRADLNRRADSDSGAGTAGDGAHVDGSDARGGEDYRS